MCFRLLSAVLCCGALLAGCGEPVGPVVQGRWAATGLELIARPFAAELRLPCATAGQVRHSLVGDSAGVIRFSTPVTGYWSSYTVDFVGQIRGDSLTATLTSIFSVGAPSVRTYTMHRDADPRFDSFYCLA